MWMLALQSFLPPLVSPVFPIFIYPSSPPSFLTWSSFIPDRPSFIAITVIITITTYHCHHYHGRQLIFITTGIIIIIATTIIAVTTTTIAITATIIIIITITLTTVITLTTSFRWPAREKLHSGGETAELF